MPHKSVGNAILLIIILLLIGVIGFLIFSKKDSQVSKPYPPDTVTSTIPTPAPPVPTSTMTVGDITTYENKQLGLKFSYPQKLLNLIEQPNKVVLSSPYYVIENYKGTPDGEFKHPFAITLEVRQKNMVAAMEMDSQAFRDAYEQGMQGQDVSSFMENFTAAGTTGVSFLPGIEGANTRYGYLPRGPNDTVVVKLTYITDFLKNAIKPQAIAEKEQLAAFEGVMKSWEFVK